MSGVKGRSGGKRKGSGRKGGVKTKMVSFRITMPNLAILEKQPNKKQIHQRCYSSGRCRSVKSKMPSTGDHPIDGLFACWRVHLFASLPILDRWSVMSIFKD
jgi:hypothetical protein